MKRSFANLNCWLIEFDRVDTACIFPSTFVVSGSLANPLYRSIHSFCALSSQMILRLTQLVWSVAQFARSMTPISYAVHRIDLCVGNPGRILSICHDKPNPAPRIGMGYMMWGYHSCAVDYFLPLTLNESIPLYSGPDYSQSIRRFRGFGRQSFDDCLKLLKKVLPWFGDMRLCLTCLLSSLTTRADAPSRYLAFCANTLAVFRGSGDSGQFQKKLINIHDFLPIVTRGLAQLETERE